MATTNILPSLSSEAFFISIRWEEKKNRGPRKSKLIRCTESESWKIVDHVAQPPIHQDCPWRRITHTLLNHFWDQLAQEGGKSPSLSSHHHLSLQEETFRERRSGKNFSPLSIKEILGNNTSVMISIMCISLTGPQGAQTFGQTALWVCLPGYFWSELSKPDLVGRPGWNKKADLSVSKGGLPQPAYLWAGTSGSYCFGTQIQT